jgi:uncharacterized protein YndB with AHSA1/START domain
MTDGSTRSVIMERTLPHPAETVWRALTQPALIAEWLMNTDFEPVVGRRFQLRSPPAPGWDGIIDGEVLEIEPHSRLAYTWGSLGLESVVTFTLTPTAAGVVLRMEQSGFREDQEQNYRGAQYGWAQFLDKLGKVLEGL